MTTSVSAEASQSVVPSSGATAAAKSSDGGMSFSDILDVINPLQHIPLVSTIYRELTGDTISPAARIAGDSLYGGLIGLASSVVNEVVEGTTGKDIGSHIWATLFGEDGDEAAKPAVADAAPAAAVGPTMISSASEPIASPAPSPSPDAAPVTPLNGPTSFFESLQHRAHGAHGVPLNATVSTGDAQKTVTANEAMLKAQQNLNGQGGAPTPNLGTTGLSSSAAPPPSIPAAPPLSSAVPATPPVVPGNISDLMLNALDKYKALALQRENDGKPAPALAPTAAVPVS